MSYNVNHKARTKDLKSLATRMKGLTDELSSRLANLKGDSAYEVAKDNGYTGTEAQWLASLKGKSAYEIAVSGGYTGTQAEWLESLKAAGEISAHESRLAGLESVTSVLNPPAWQFKNFMWSGKNLGSEFTSAQLNAIKSGKFDGIGIGDYWTSGSRKWMVVHLNYEFCPGGTKFQAVDLDTGETRVSNWSGTAADTNMGSHIVLMEASKYKRTEPYYTAAQIANGELAYAQSNWYKVVRPVFLENAVNFFGDSHVLEWRDNFASSFGTDGLPSGYVTGWGRCELPLFSQVTGRTAMDPWGRGQLNTWNSDMQSFGQFAFFKLGHKQYNIKSIALRDFAGNGSGTYSCLAYSYRRMWDGWGATSTSQSSYWSPMIIVG